MVCVRVHELSRSAVKAHRHVKSKYWRLRISKLPVPSTLTDYCIDSYPLAHYPTRLEILRSYDRRMDEIPSGTLDRLCAMAKRTGLIPEQRVQYWFNEMLSSEVAITAFLLPNLLSLETLLFMGQRWDGLESVEEIVNAVMESQRRSENPQALSKLDSLIVRNIGEITEFKYFLTFMQLASLRRIDGSRLDCQGIHNLSFPPGTSLVECLKLDQSIIPGNVFSILLGGIKALKVLQYSPLCNAEYDLRAMRNALLEYQRHTLEELDIASDKRPRAFMGSLREFPEELYDVDAGEPSV